MNLRIRNILAVLTVIITIVSLLAGPAGFCFKDTAQVAEEFTQELTDSDGLTEMIGDAGASIGNVSGLSVIPEYDGNAYVTVNGNKPQFGASLKTEESWGM